MDISINKHKGVRIALGYQSRVGKDTFADYLVSKGLAIKLSFAEDVYIIATWIQKFIGKPVEKDRGLLQLVGTGITEHYGEPIWTKRLMEKVNKVSEEHPNLGIVVTDMRFPSDMKALVNAGFTTIKITRKNRPIDEYMDHISERALADAKFDYTITNDGSFKEFGKKVQTLWDCLQMNLQMNTRLVNIDDAFRDVKLLGGSHRGITFGEDIAYDNIMIPTPDNNDEDEEVFPII